MSAKSPPPIFLQRASYRQRRLRDAAKILPFLGVVLWAIPLAWAHGDASTDVGTGGLIYVFAVWVLLIVLSALLSRRVISETDDAGDDKEHPPR